MIRSGYWDGDRGSLETFTESPDCVKCHPLTPKPTNSLQGLYLNVLGTAEKQYPVVEKCILIMFEASGCTDVLICLNLKTNRYFPFLFHIKLSANVLACIFKLYICAHEVQRMV